MRKITHLSTVAWPLPGNQRLAWYSAARRAFVLGNHADKCLLSTDADATISPLVKWADAYAVKTTAYDDQLSSADYYELAAQGLGGFQFLAKEQYDRAFGSSPWGSVCPVDQALISGLTNQLPVLHPATGAIVSFGDKRITLHSLTAAGLSKTGEVKPPSGQAIADMLAGPGRAFLYYITNKGDVMAVAVTREKIGPQRKWLSLQKPGACIRASADGSRFFIGGMGLLVLTTGGEKPGEIIARQEVPCRGIKVLDDGWLLVNQGMHGFTLFEAANDQLRADASQKTPEPADRLIASPDGLQVLCLTQPPGPVSLYEIL
jgi:hypothetical protein